jgi:hypothetical protein
MALPGQANLNRVITLKDKYIYIYIYIGCNISYKQIWRYFPWEIHLMSFNYIHKFSDFNSLSLSLSLFLLLLSFSFSFFFELKLLIYYILNIAFSRFTTRLIDQSKSKLDFTFGVTWLLRKVDRHP